MQGHIHIGAENTSADRNAAIGLQLTAIGIVQCHSLIASHGAYIARTIAATCRGRQRKLAHGYYFALDIADAAVHHSGVIIKNAQRRGFTGQPSGIFFGITIFDTHQNQHPGIDGRHRSVSFDGHGRLTYSLYDYSHIEVSLINFPYRRLYATCPEWRPPRTYRTRRYLVSVKYCVSIHKTYIVYPEGKADGAYIRLAAAGREHHDNMRRLGIRVPSRFLDGDHLAL